MGRLPEDNFVAPRSPHQFYQPRVVRPLLHRPLTTQKPSLLDSRRTTLSIQDRATIPFSNVPTLANCLCRPLESPTDKIPPASPSSSNQRAASTGAAAGGMRTKLSRKPLLRLLLGMQLPKNKVEYRWLIPKEREGKAAGCLTLLVKTYVGARLGRSSNFSNM